MKKKENQDIAISKKNPKNGNIEVRNDYKEGALISPTNELDTVTIIESKKRRTNDNVGSNNQMGLNSEIIWDSGEDDNMHIEQVSPRNSLDSKNGLRVGAHVGAHLSF